MHPLYGALPVPYMWQCGYHGALIAHRYTYAPSCCRTSHGRMFFIPLSVSLWNVIADIVFDGVGMARFKSPLLVSLTLFFDVLSWYCGVTVFGLMGCNYLSLPTIHWWRLLIIITIILMIIIIIIIIIKCVHEQLSMAFIRFIFYRNVRNLKNGRSICVYFKHQESRYYHKDLDSFEVFNDTHNQIIEKLKYLLHLFDENYLFIYRLLLLVYRSKTDLSRTDLLAHFQLFS